MTSRGAPELRLESVSHVYQQGEVRALDEVSLTIGPGEVVALVGQNGSGKTTLVRHLNGLLRPTTGRVLVDGQDAAVRTVAQLARDVGLVFQDPDRQIFAGSVRSEIEFGPRNIGLRGDELRAAVDDAMAAVGLAEAARTNPYDLGASRRKLLALASVLAMRTPVLVLDEPTTGQDVAGVERVRHALGEARASRAHRHRHQPRHGVRGRRVRACGGHGWRPGPGRRHAGRGLRALRLGAAAFDLPRTDAGGARR